MTSSTSRSAASAHCWAWGALCLDALLLGLQDLLGDAAFVVELDELLLLSG
jgi:hypothetical protein